MKHTPPPLLFPDKLGIISARCTEKPVGSMAKSGLSRDIQVSVRQIMEQSLISLWKEIRAQSLLSRGWMLASRILASGGRSARRLNLTRTPALFPLLQLRFRRRGRVAQTKGSAVLFVNSGSVLGNLKYGLWWVTVGTDFQKCLSVVNN